MMRQTFDAVADAALGPLAPGEDALLWWAEERSLFARFHCCRVRQAGEVVQREATLRLIHGQRHASTTFTVGGDDHDAVVARVRAEVLALRALVAELPDDPHLLWSQDGSMAIDDEALTPLPPVATMLAAVHEAAGDADLVGILAAGPIARGFASSRGARGWFARTAVVFDYSLHLSRDKAVKATVASAGFDAVAVRASIAAARRRLALLTLPPVTLARGAVRAWLEPAAVAEILGLLAYGGFSELGQRTRQSPLVRLVAGERRLAPQVTLSERAAAGLGPRFGPEGFVRPAEVALIRAGAHAGALIAPRTAAEYGVAGNGAGASEAPTALVMAAGDLDPDASETLVGDGVWIGNLWYLNWSDRAQARLTGMTRFASFVVRDGRIVGPLEVMRFDDSLFDLLGDRLVGLGRDATWMPDTGTYGRRSTDTVTAPAALIDGLTFTL